MTCGEYSQENFRLLCILLLEPTTALVGQLQISWVTYLLDINVIVVVPYFLPDVTFVQISRVRTVGVDLNSVRLFCTRH